MKNFKLKNLVFVAAITLVATATVVLLQKHQLLGDKLIIVAGATATEMLRYPVGNQ